MTMSAAKPSHSRLTDHTAPGCIRPASRPSGRGSAQRHPVPKEGEQRRVKPEEHDEHGAIDDDKPEWKVVRRFRTSGITHNFELRGFAIHLGTLHRIRHSTSSFDLPLSSDVEH